MGYGIQSHRGDMDSRGFTGIWRLQSYRGDTETPELSRGYASSISFEYGVLFCCVIIYIYFYFILFYIICYLL
jgi:hypothetical protein